MRFWSTNVPARRLAGALIALAAATGCSQAGNSPTAPSASTGTGALSSSGATLAAKPPSGAATTAVSFSNFDAGTLTVDINTTTSAALGQPYINDGKIQLEILVDSTGKPVPCGTAGATYMRFDPFANGGLNPGNGATSTTGVTSTSIDLASLGAACGDTICIRARYITGGGNTHVDTHASADTAYTVVCDLGCTLTQGYWKTHYPDDWAGSVIAGGLTLGTVSYTAAQLEAIYDTTPSGNGLIALAHQLIAAKMNIANGADPTAVASSIAAADALIGGLHVPPVGGGWLAPSATDALTQALNDYNLGVTGPGHCD